MSELYLRDATWIDPKTHAITRGNLHVRPGPGGQCEFVEHIPENADEVDVRGKIVTQAFAVGHHHAYSGLARGMPAPPRAPGDFVEILELVWWRLDRRLDRDMVAACAWVTALDAARSGASYVIDHHASPNALPGCLDTLAEAFDQVGVGHLLCVELSDRDGPATAAAGLAETDRYLSHRPGLVGLHASFTVGDGLLRDAVDLARRHHTGLHVHVAEAASDEAHCVATYGRRVLERFAEAGVLDVPRTILAHGLHLDDAERALFASSRAWLAQNAESNANNGVGTFDPRGLGDRIFLGTDGMNGDMLASLRAASFAAPAVGGLSPAAAVARLRRVHDYLADNGLDAGTNDLVVLDYDAPTPITADNWASHLVYGVNRSHVWGLVRHGRVVVLDRAVVTVDEAEILREARVQAGRLWAALQES